MALDEIEATSKALEQLLDDRKTPPLIAAMALLFVVTGRINRDDVEDRIYEIINMIYPELSCTADHEAGHG
jgi:hypothetical protein